jgi:hypothetical protein
MELVNLVLVDAKTRRTIASSVPVSGWINLPLLAAYFNRTGVVHTQHPRNADAVTSDDASKFSAPLKPTPGTQHKTSPMTVVARHSGQRP